MPQRNADNSPVISFYLLRVAQRKEREGKKKKADERKDRMRRFSSYPRIAPPRQLRCICACACVRALTFKYVHCAFAYARVCVHVSFCLSKGRIVLPLAGDHKVLIQLLSVFGN